MQNRVLSSLQLGGSLKFCHPVTQYWTPHSRRSSLPSATLLLDFLENQRDCSGVWNAQASDKYARTSLRIITKLLRAVIRAIHSSSPDPLAEQDLAEDFEEFPRLSVLLRTQLLSACLS